MKKLVCGCFGNIYYATILKNGYMSDKGRVDVTDDAVEAVLNHLVRISPDTWKEDGFAGYTIEADNGKEICLVAYDKSKCKLGKNEE